MEDKLKTVFAAVNSAEAHMFKQKLETEGIDCIVTDEFTVSVNPFYNHSIGGIKVQVREVDYDRALEVIRENNLVETRSGSVPCARCGSEETEHKKTGVLMAIISTLTLGLPFAVRRREWKCRSCGLEWKDKLQFHQVFFGVILLIFVVMLWTVIIEIV